MKLENAYLERYTGSICSPVFLQLMIRQSVAQASACPASKLSEEPPLSVGSISNSGLDTRLSLFCGSTDNILEVVDDC